MRACLFAVLLALVSAPAPAADKPEPKYKNHPLAFWVKRLQEASTDAEQKEAATAISTFGPEAATAVPVLVAMLDDRSWEFCEMITKVLCEIGPGAKAAVPQLVKFLKEKKATDPEHVIRVLTVIGPDAKDAVPALSAFLDDSELNFCAVSALCAIGPAAKDAVPAMQKVVLAIVAAKEQNSDSDQYITRSGAIGFRSNCLDGLSDLGEEGVPILLAMLDKSGKWGAKFALRQFAKLGPSGIKAAPELKKILKHDEPEFRYLACEALWNIAKSPDVVSVLAALLTTDRAVSAAVLLEQIGPAAKDALSTLQKASQSDDPDVRRAAQEAIDKIEQKSKK